MNKNTLIVIGLIVVAIIIAALIATRRRVKGGTTLGWKFFRQMDSEGSDIKYMPGLAGNISGLKQACKDTDGCVAFNTAGYLKSSIDPNNFKEYSGYPDWAGLYVKRSILK